VKVRCVKCGSYNCEYVEHRVVKLVDIYEPTSTPIWRCRDCGNEGDLYDENLFEW